MQVDALFFSHKANDVNSILVFDDSTNHLACFEQKLDWTWRNLESTGVVLWKFLFANWGNLH